MIKEVPVNQLRTGMYVHNLECRWLDHPFATNRFKLKSSKDLAEIQRLGVTSVHIDTDKGLDVQMNTVPDETKPSEAVTTTSTTIEEKASPPVPLENELFRANRVMKEATDVITDVMEDVRIGKQIEVERVTPIVENMVTSLFNNDGALLGLTRIRRMDRYTFEHSVSVAVHLTAFGKQLGLEQEELVQLGVGGLLHDIGKIKTPPQILNKPGKLTDDEFTIMRQHAVHSREILKETPGISDTSLSIAAEHHERFDGTGYPLKKAGDDICFFGQMAAIVDVYDALTAERVYKKGMSPHAALKLLTEGRNKHFNADLVYNFIHCVGVYPIGTLVQLSDGRLAVVLEHSEQGPLYPRIRIMFDVIKRRFLTPKDVDLSKKNGSGVAIVGAQDAAKWRITPDTYLDHAKI